MWKWYERMEENLVPQHHQVLLRFANHHSRICLEGCKKLLHFSSLGHIRSY